MGLLKAFGGIVSNLRQPKYAALFQSKTFTGMYSNRAVFHDPSDIITEKYYGGKPDAIFTGTGVELTNDLTIARAYGTTPFSDAIYPTPPLRFFSFEYNDAIQVLVDTAEGLFLDAGDAPPLPIVTLGGTLAPADTWGSTMYTHVPAASVINPCSEWTITVGVSTLEGTNPVTSQHWCVKRTLPGSLTVIDSTEITFAGSNSPTFYEVGLYVSDTVALEIDDAHDYWFMVYTAFVSGNDAQWDFYVQGASPISGGNWYDNVDYTLSANIPPSGTPLGRQNLILLMAWEPVTPPLFVKSALAGQGYGLAIGNTFYFGDGSETIKYTPWNPNGTIWNWGIAPPLAAPTVVTTQTGSTSTAWAASTVFSTMGLLVDPNGNVQQLYSVNSSGTNITQYGKSGSGAPNFNTSIGFTTTDGSVTWTSYNQIELWTPNTNYSVSGSTIPVCVYDPKTNCLFGPLPPGGTSGATYPNFLPQPILTIRTPDNNMQWLSLGVVNVPPTFFTTWKKATAYPTWASKQQNSLLAYPYIPYVDASGKLCGGRDTFTIACTTAGTSANANYTPWTGIPTQLVGDRLTDGDLVWVCQGPAAWASATAYTQWAIGETTFGVVKDSNGNMQVCISGGQTAISAPTWGTTYGALTTDGTVTWTCVGPPITWQALTQWYLPPLPDGFVPPQSSEPYGGAVVIGDAYVQSVTGTTGVGTTGATAPTWPTTIGNTVSDHDVTWKTVGKYSANTLSWTDGYVYCFSYKCRTPTDYYATNIPPGLTTANGPYTGGGTGAISTSSPVFTITGANSGAINTTSGPGSLDPQVDTIVLFRSADGGGADNMFELKEFPAPKPVGGVPATWAFQDYLPETPTSVFPGLDELVPAPIDEANNPPPISFLPTAWHFQRIWGPNSSTSASSTIVNFSGGPAVITGNPNECFNPADEFPFLENVTSCIHTPSGLIVVQPSNIDCIYGGPATASFYSTTLFPGKGCNNFNAIDVLGGEIYMFTSDSQLIAVTPSLQVSNLGFPIGDQLVGLDSAVVYLTVYDEGNDNGVYISNGGTGFFRMNPHQVPQGDAIWSPQRIVSHNDGATRGGLVSPGDRALLMRG